MTSQESKNSPAISEHSVRSILRRRRVAPAGAAGAGNGRPGERPVTTEEAESTARPATPLRRWSVADLIAEALTRPPADGFSH